MTIHASSELVDRGLRSVLAPYADAWSVAEVGESGSSDVDLFEVLDVDSMAAVVRSPPFDLSGQPLVFCHRPTAALIRIATVAGARGVLSSHVNAAELVEALCSVTRGAHVFKVQSHARVPATGLDPGLSPREAETVSLIALGLSNREIAEAMYISLNTVKSYIAVAYRKIGARTRVEAVLWARGCA